MFSLAEHFPAITDVDADGDLDILAYKSSSGTQVVFFRNISEDCDDLEFTLDTDCFGDFNDNTFIPLDLNAGCDNFTGGGSGETALHGVSSLLYSDADGDGLKDLFIGNEYYNNITVLYNDGTTDSCHFYAQDNSWPSATTPVTLTALPTGMELDLNLDGEPSIVFSVRGNAAGENYSCSQLYQKNMAGEYDLNSSTFFTPYMMDCGSYSYPVFFDYNNDGLMDIVVGNLGYYDPTLAYRGSLTLYENVGTLEEPSFELIDRDYLGLSVLQKRYFAPAFGDLDGDGDQDLLLGLEDGKMYFFNNVPSGDLIPSFIPISPNFEGLDVGSHASPQIVDLDHDGLLDLLIGTKVGYLVFYKNIGTVTSPSFAEGVVQVGNVDTRTAETVTGYAAPFASDIETPGEFLLYCGSESGEIFRYNDIEENLEAGESFTLIDSLFAGIDPGARSKISIADIDMDGFPEMVIGNSRGGLSFLDLGMDSMVSTTQLHPSDMGLEIYPNPNFEGSFNIKFKASSPTDLDVQVYDLDGRLLSSTSTLQHDFIKVKMNVEYPSGIYIVQVYSDEKVYTGKINFQ